VQESAAMEAADDSGSASADEMTCSICLQHTELEEIASISPGCGHSYCGEQHANLLQFSCHWCYSGETNASSCSHEVS
jgi:hypothetical protein